MTMHKPQVHIYSNSKFIVNIYENKPAYREKCTKHFWFNNPSNALSQSSKRCNGSTSPLILNITLAYIETVNTYQNT
jgi:hypothetical protein